jgi:alpha-tubulin suppressor-like RCC1 family protein
VYLSDVKTASSKFKKMAVVSLNSFTLIGLKSDTVYYVIVTAFNKNGEGYLSKVPNFVRTSPTTTQHPCSLYVWGSNTNSELGLDERDV